MPVIEWIVYLKSFAGISSAHSITIFEHIQTHPHPREKLEVAEDTVLKVK